MALEYKVSFLVNVSYTCHVYSVVESRCHLG